MASSPLGFFWSSLTTRTSVKSLCTASGMIFFKSTPHLNLGRYTCIHAELEHHMFEVMRKHQLEGPHPVT